MLPFQNLSPHPEIQEERATALWKIATGDGLDRRGLADRRHRIRLRAAEYYADLARTRAPRRVASMSTVCSATSIRLDITPPTWSRCPANTRFAEAFSMCTRPKPNALCALSSLAMKSSPSAKFDPASQRSSNPVDEALLLPLTETPVSDQLLGAIHTRLSGKRITGNEEIVEAAVRSGGVTVFPGLGILRAGRGSGSHRLRSAADAACCSTSLICCEPNSIASGRAWRKRTNAAASATWFARRTLYLPPEVWWQKVADADRRRSRVSRHHAQRRLPEPRSLC